MKKESVIILLLFSIHFWGYTAFTEYNKYTDLIALLVLGISFSQTYNIKVGEFRAPIFLFLIGTVCNILSAFINNGQSPLDTFLTFGSFYYILFYFYLHERKIDRNFIENLVIVLALLYTVMYLIQFNAYPNRIFNGTLFEDRGTIRLRMEGSGFLILAYFMLLNRFLLQRKIWQISIALFLFAILFKTGYRTLTAASILLSAIMFMKMLKYSAMNYLMIVLVAIMFLGLLQIESNAIIFQEMLSAQENTQEMGDDYIRKIQFDFFSNVYPKNFSYYIFGGGYPGSKGSYAAYMDYLENDLGFYWVDIGLMGFYFVIGLVTLAGMLWFVIKSIFIKLPPTSVYLSYYFAYLLLTSITTSEMYLQGMFVVQAFAMYIIDVSLKPNTEQTVVTN